GSPDALIGAVFAARPSTYEEAMKSKEAAQWSEAIKEQMKEIERCNTFTVTDYDASRKVITCRWVFTTKGKEDSKVFKARLVARGFQQKYGVDFWETYSPTVSLTTIRTFLTLAKSNGM